MTPTVDALPTGRFSGRVENYVRHRPRYPRATVELLREEIGLRPEWRVADVGAGPGISAELFLDHGHPVIAVEPNRAMLEAAVDALGARPGFRALAGTAEALPLRRDSVDLVFSGQAFHWFDPGLARAEFRRVLRGEGFVVLAWYTRQVDASPFMRSFEELLLRHGTDYTAVRHDRREGEALAELYGRPPERRVLRTRQVLDRDGLEGRLLSCSYVPLRGEEGHRPMIRDARRIFDEHAVDGTVRMLYDVEVYFGRPGVAP